MNDYRRGQAYLSGTKAARRGKPETANNRERGTIYFDDWWDGWNSVTARARTTPQDKQGED